MKSIDNKAVRNQVEKKFNIMMGAHDVDSLKVAYEELQSSLKRYYDVCLSVAEYNELLAEFAPATVEYEPMDA